MPTLAVFDGIRISMNYNDHPPAHFHAEYQNFEVIVEIGHGAVEGKMPRRALALIWIWLDEHRDELLANWENAQQRRPSQPIKPLE